MARKINLREAKKITKVDRKKRIPRKKSLTDQRKEERSQGLKAPKNQPQKVHYKEKKHQAINHRERVRIYQQENQAAARDIAPLPLKINWERRLACKYDPKLFFETYLSAIFFKGWADDHLRCIEKLKDTFINGGMFSLAMPRAGGKTAISRGGLIWGTAYAHKKFPYLIGSTDPSSRQSLSAIKTLWYRSHLLREDFPEIAYPVYKLEGRFHLARGQTFNREPTYIEWGTDFIRYACLLLSKEDAETYLKHDESSVRYHDDFQKYYLNTAGICIATTGVGGTIRGEAELHPITLEQPRPDIVLLDDIQKDQTADSPAACEKLIRLVDGAIQGLAPPGQHIAALMPCTVIREDDVADTFLSHEKRPEWRGERCAMVTSWPPGMTDWEITLETPESRAWNEYGELRLKSYRLYEDARLASEYYKKNRKLMDSNFTVSWSERYDKDAELSAQQHAMNLRFRSPDTFPAEYQNQGRRLITDTSKYLTARQLAEKTVNTKRFHAQPDASIVTAFIDVQNEILFWAILAVSHDMNGIFSAYGTWPEINSHYFTKDQTAGWSLLTTEFFKTYPQHRNQATKTESGKIRAPFDAKIYHALQKGVEYVSNMVITRDDEYGAKLKINKLGIDTRWGEANEVIKRFIRECKLPNLVACQGQDFPATRKQIEEYQMKQGWLFEHTVNPSVKEPKWIYRPNTDGGFVFQSDISRTKDYLHARLASPLGHPGSIALHDAPSQAHEMFANHLCSSEYPEEIYARGIKKNQWIQREGTSFDNDWLDCAVGCVNLASYQGAFLKLREGESSPKKIRRSLSARFNEKRRA